MKLTMQQSFDLLPNHPLWQRQAGPRLAISLLVAAVLVAIVLTLLQFPVAQVIRPGPEILIRLIPEVVEPLTQMVPEVAADPVETTDRRTRPTEDMPAPEARDTGSSPDVVEPPRDSVDWYGRIEAAARAVGDEGEKIESANPMFDAKRRKAAEQFYPSRAPVKREIWENVETDQLGRKILVSGNCYRVIDDPSAANYDIWREFQQYLVYCWAESSTVRTLPWIEEIGEPYLYLQYPDGQIPDEKLREYVEH